MRNYLKRIMALGLVAASICLAGCSSDSDSFDYPENTIELVVPSTAGGGSDLLARALAESIDLPESMVVVNRDGGSGTIGTTEVAQATGDGYTLLLGMVGPFETQPHLLDLTYDIDDFRYIAGLSVEEFFLAVPSSSGITSLDEFVATYDGEEIYFGSSSVGSVPHLAQEFLYQEIGLTATNVPYSGSNEVIVSLLGGHIEAMVAQYGELVAYADSGEMNLIAMFSEERSPMAPDVPTVKEQGYDVAFSAIKFIAAPKDTPDEIVDYLAEKVEEAKLSDSYLAFLETTQTVACNSTEEEMIAQLWYEHDVYGDLIEQLGLN